MLARITFTLAFLAALTDSRNAHAISAGSAFTKPAQSAPAESTYRLDSDGNPVPLTSAEIKGRAEQEKFAREDRQYVYAQLEKSETLSFVLSGTIGFGAGHFYVGEYEMGLGFAAAELILGVLGAPSLIGGTFVADYSHPSTVQVAGAAVRAADAITAALMAAGHNEELERRFITGSVRPKITLGPGPSIGAGLALRF
jgi:hypothetical protein